MGMIRLFTDTLRLQRRGKLLAELSDHMNALVGAVRATGKKGSITITLSVEPLKETEEQVYLRDKVALKMPNADTPASLFYIDRENNLTRTAPDQEEFDFHAIDGEATVVNDPGGLDAATADDDAAAQGAN